mmetsp:Transcript_10345/g.17093  ORF Transcript_10345/g.17093 Transcript_10345/m.17093 type:complete len:257 (-) Transcript_10345:480-1250(-)
MAISCNKKGKDVAYARWELPTIEVASKFSTAWVLIIGASPAIHGDQLFILKIVASIQSFLEYTFIKRPDTTDEASSQFSTLEDTGVPMRTAFSTTPRKFAFASLRKQWKIRRAPNENPIKVTGRLPCSNVFMSTSASIIPACFALLVDMLQGSSIILNNPKSFIGISAPGIPRDTVVADNTSSRTSSTAFSFRMFSICLRIDVSKDFSQTRMYSSPLLATRFHHGWISLFRTISHDDDSRSSAHATVSSSSSSVLL